MSYGSYAYREQCRRDSRRAKIVGFAAFILYIAFCGIDSKHREPFELTAEQRAEVVGRWQQVPHSLEQAAMVKNQKGRWP